MMRRALHIAIVLSTLVLCGCPVHQWPRPKTHNTQLLHLHFEPDFWLWEHDYDPVQGIVVERDPDHGVDDDHPGTSERYDGSCDHGTMRIAVRAYLPGNYTNCVGDYTFTREVSGGYDCDVELDLGAGEYVLLVWADLVENEADAPYYNIADFRRVQLIYSDYRANTDYRDGYRGRATVGVLANRTEDDDPEYFEVTMRRPMAKYEFVTTDLSEFLAREATRRNLSTRANIEDYLVEIVYPFYLPFSYSAVDDRLENSTTNVHYEAQVTVTGESEASLGFDYVFINNISNAGAQAEIYVYDMTGECVAHSRLIQVPLRRNHHTLLRGAFLTMMEQGGVGIDPGYDGDHNVIFSVEYDGDDGGAESGGTDGGGTP